MHEDCSFIVTTDPKTRAELLKAGLTEFSVHREDTKETFFFVNEPKKTLQFANSSDMKMHFTSMLSF